MSNFRLTRAKLETFVRDLQLGSTVTFAAIRAEFPLSDLGDPFKTPTGRIWQTPFGDLIEQGERYRLNSN